MPMGSTRMGDHSIVEVDAEVKNTVKSQEQGPPIHAPGATKK